MKKLIIVPATSLCLIFGAAPAIAATPAPQPTVVCDAYSGGCVTPAPITDAPISGETAKTPTDLPHTGFTNGDAILIGLASLAVGTAIVAMVRPVRENA